MLMSEKIWMACLSAVVASVIGGCNSAEKHSIVYNSYYELSSVRPQYQQSDCPGVGLIHGRTRSAFRRMVAPYEPVRVVGKTSVSQVSDKNGYFCLFVPAGHYELTIGGGDGVPLQIKDLQIDSCAVVTVFAYLATDVIY